MLDQNIETYGLTELQCYHRIIKFLEKNDNHIITKLISIEMIEDNNPIVTYQNWKKEIEKFNKNL